MVWENFVKLLSALFGLLGSALLAYGVLQVSPKDMAEQTTSGFGYNSYQIDAIAHEKADKITGFHFVSVSFIFSAVALFVPRVRPSLGWFVLVIMFSSALVIAVWLNGKDIYQDSKRAIDESVTSR